MGGIVKRSLAMDLLECGAAIAKACGLDDATQTNCHLLVVHSHNQADCYACPGRGITFSCGATTVPFSKSRAVGARVRLYHWLSVFLVRSDHLTI